MAALQTLYAYTPFLSPQNRHSGICGLEGRFSWRNVMMSNDERQQDVYPVASLDDSKITTE